MALSAVQGLERQLATFDKAAARLASPALDTGTAATLQISEAARAANRGGTPAGGGSGIEGALLDVRTSKYLAIANMKVLQTADELSEVESQLVRPTRD